MRDNLKAINEARANPIVRPGFAVFIRLSLVPRP
jgi:hypothetical protein